MKSGWLKLFSRIHGSVKSSRKDSDQSGQGLGLLFNQAGPGFLIYADQLRIQHCLGPGTMAFPCQEADFTKNATSSMDADESRASVAFSMVPVYLSMPHYVETISNFPLFVHHSASFKLYHLDGLKKAPHRWPIRNQRSKERILQHKSLHV
tara:strand:- start:256435 stop:256887 length:453 start_codon:yes stop_codon:yes gene_type:complete